MPGPGQRDEAGGDPRLLELVVELADDGRRALALALDDLDLRAQVEDPLLERVLLGLQLVRGLDQRRPLLGRVADARTLGGELGGDQEAEREQRDPERDLPGRDRAQAPDRDHGDGADARRRRAASADGHQQDDHADRDERRRPAWPPSSAAGSPGAAGTGVAVAPPEAPAAGPWLDGGRDAWPPGAAPVQADGTGPGGAGCGPNLVFGVGVDVLEPGVAERGHVEPERSR